MSLEMMNQLEGFRRTYRGQIKVLAEAVNTLHRTTREDDGGTRSVLPGLHHDLLFYLGAEQEDAFDATMGRAREEVATLLPAIANIRAVMAELAPVLDQTEAVIVAAISPPEEE